MCYNIKLSMTILIVMMKSHLAVLLLLFKVGMTQLISWLIQTKENQAYNAQPQEHLKL